MPLQGKIPFKRKTPKGVAHLDQELFYCKTTNEVFTDYEELFERAIQCSSLVWTCSLTGRGGLTFQEACESECRAKKILQTIPYRVKQLVLQQVSKCKASRLQDLNDKVFSLIQNRYVVGETVEVVFHGVKKVCEITEVRTPGSSLKNKSPTKKSNESPKKASPSKLRYEVCEKESDVQVLHVVAPDSLSRPKGALSKDKCKLILKQSCKNENGVLKVKNSLTQKYQLGSQLNAQSPTKKVKSDKISKSVSPLKSAKLSKPSTPSKASAVKSALKNSQSPSKIKKTLKSIDADIRKMFPKKSGKLSQQSKENNPISAVNVKVNKDLKMEEDKKKREDLKEKKKTEAKLLNDYVLEWKKRREDLECEDLKDLPLATPINCGIPRDIFGEAVAIMEFLHQFSSVLQVKNTFSNGFKLELMEKALTNTDIQGPFSDLLHLLLLAVFKQQDLEEEEPDKTKSSNNDNEGDLSSAVKAANSAASWSIEYLGCKIRRFPLDPFTLTELLRLHLLASGADITTVASDRGNFKNIEDPGLAFRKNNQAIVKKLETTSVFLLFPEERLKILTVLTEQLLTYPTFREILDKAAMNLRKANIDLQNLYKERRKYIKVTEPSNGNEKENLKDPESILLNSEKVDMPTLLESKLPHVLTEEEKAELEKFQQKVKELRNTINKILSSFRIEPIGSDRAHRNFWLFNSVDGFFVEDCNPYVGQCLPKPTPTQLTIKGMLSQEELPLAFMHKFFSIINNNHNKENNLTKLNRQNVNGSHKKLLSNVNGLTQVKAEAKEDSSEVKTGRVVFGMCIANPAKCLVHGPNPDRLTWSFYHDEKDLDNLVSGLNSRGYREYNLKHNILHNKVKIKESMAKCPKIN